jgi:hypothetical protein
MSLLGFDALGRLALGQLSTIGLTNTVLAAGAGSYAIAGQAAVFKPTQLSGSGVLAVTGNPAAFGAALSGSTRGYAITGSAAIFRFRFRALKAAIR